MPHPPAKPCARPSTSGSAPPTSSTASSTSTKPRKTPPTPPSSARSRLTATTSTPPTPGYKVMGDSIDLSLFTGRSNSMPGYQQSGRPSSTMRMKSQRCLSCSGPTAPRRRTPQGDRRISSRPAATHPSGNNLRRTRRNRQARGLPPDRYLRSHADGGDTSTSRGLRRRMVRLRAAPSPGNRQSADASAAEQWASRVIGACTEMASDTWDRPHTIANRPPRH